MRLVAEIIIHTLDGNHRLTVLIDSQRLIFHTLCCNIYLRQLANFGQDRVIARRRLTFCRNEFQLWIKAGKQSCHQVMESIEHTQHDDQRHRSHSYTNRRDGTDDIDGMSALLGKEISASNEKWKIHLSFTFLLFYFLTFLLFQEFIYALQIIQTIIEEEA